MMGYPSIYHEINSSDENQTADKLRLVKNKVYQRLDDEKCKLAL